MMDPRKDLPSVVRHPRVLLSGIQVEARPRDGCWISDKKDHGNAGMRKACGNVADSLPDGSEKDIRGVLLIGTYFFNIVI